MKKLLLFLVFMFFTVLGTYAYTVQVGSGTSTNSYYPLYTCYGYNYSQQIYLASEISAGGGSAGSISKIRFYYGSGGTTYANWRSWTVYLGNTSQSSFSGTTNWIPVGSLTQVFSGNIATPVAGTWLEITLDAPFAYSGGNLVVAIDENSSSYSCTASWRSFVSGSNRGLLYYSDGTNPNPASPPTATRIDGTIAQIQLEFATPCAGVPNPGNTVASVNPACSGVNFTLSLQNVTDGTGVSYQWQSSPTARGPWTNIGSSTPTHTTSLTASTYYRCAVTCANSGSTTNSNPVNVTLAAWYYCILGINIIIIIGRDIS